MNSILEVTNFTKGFFKKKALSDINLTLTRGNIYGLIGPNGSGKSTLMKSIYGMVKGRGSITADGRRGVNIRNIVSYMPTEDYFYPYMRVEEVVKFYLDMYPDFNSERAYELLEYMQIDPKDSVSGLSTGMRMRLKLVLCLARECSLYMLDEPLNGIDIISKKKITETIIGSMSEDKAIIISSHLLGDIELILDRVIFLKKGNLVLEDSLEAIREERNTSLEDLYWEVYND